MDPTYQIISAIIGTGIVIMLAPRVLASNRGVMLRNIAIWVGIFLLLALAYRSIGPGAGVIEQAGSQATTSQQQTSEQDNEDTKTIELKEEDGFSPPQGD